MTATPSAEQVLSASPEGLVLMLFEGAVRFGREAREALARGDRAEGERLTGRLRAVVEELDRGLNPAAGTISRHLGAIYEYVLRRLDAETVDAETLAEVIADLGVLCDAWTVLVAERSAEQHVRSEARAPALA